MLPECVEIYNKAQKAGQKYVKAAIKRGSFPYPLVLDEILEHQSISGTQDLGIMNIPSNLIIGTRSAGRIYALSGDFMPLLSAESEFAAKWLNLCNDQLGDEGIRQPIKCYEFLGNFYVEEGNKRVSVLKTLGAPAIAANVIRMIPAYSDDSEIKNYYEFMDFHKLSGLYGISFTTPGGYEKLQAALGFDPDHVWTENERRAFQSGYLRFSQAFEKYGKKSGDMTEADALLSFLDVFAFSDIKNSKISELEKMIARIMPDTEVIISDDQIELKTSPKESGKGLISRVRGITAPNHLNIAFIYAFDPELSVWTREHDMGRKYLQERMGNRIKVNVIHAYDRNYLSALEKAAAGGADVIFATTPTMIEDCRAFATTHEDIKVLNCSLSQPYQSVRTYYSRVYETKFITGAIAGSMADNDLIGYVSNYPIFSAPASINAFALGARLTNPRARVQLAWSCTPGDPIEELRSYGINLISNRDAKGPQKAHLALDWGVYRIEEDESLTQLAAPHWYWGRLYRQIIESIFSNTWEDAPRSKALNYWWGMDSGVIDVKFGDSLPPGVLSLAQILRDGIINGIITPYKTRITDQYGNIRNEGEFALTADEILSMDYLCDNVVGSIPALDEISPEAMETVRRMGIHREYLPPEIHEKQL